MRQSPVVMFLLVALSLLVIILATGVWSVSRRVGSLEYYSSSNRSAVDKQQAELTTSASSLSRRTKAVENDLELWSRLVGGLQKSASQLQADMDELKTAGTSSVSPEEIDGLKAGIQALRDEIAQVKELAETAADKPAAAAAPAEGAPAAKDVEALTSRLDSLNSRIEEVAKKSASSPAPNVQLNEQAVREAIDRAVQDQVSKALEEFRDSARARRPRTR